MRLAREKNSPKLMFFLSVVLFAASAAAGMFAAYYMEGGLYDSLCSYVSSALGNNIGFKQTFINAIRSDFRYTFTVLIAALSIFSSFIPLLMTGFKGFSSGLAVALAARSAKSVQEAAAFCSAVFAACVLTVPVYVLMFMLCFKFAAHSRDKREAFSQKFKNYLEFFAAVMLLFLILCVFDCLQAAIGSVI